MITRLFWIAVNAVFELITDRVLAGLLCVGAFIILAGDIVASLSLVERQRMILDTGLGAIFLVGVLTTLFSGANLIEREIRERQVFVTLSKPIPRNVWLAGKTLGLITVIAGVVLSLTLFLFFFTKLETGQWVFRLFLGGFVLYLMLLVLAGYTILFSTMTSQFMALFFSFLVVIIGHSVDDLRIYWGSQSLGARALTKFLYYVIPNLESFSSWPVVLGKVRITGELLFYLVLYSLAYLVIPVAIASLILDRKEFE